MANTKVQSEQIEDGSITADKIADGAIVATELADNAVTTAKINADAVTGAKIADDAINSEHYTDGSIDTAHIADSQITVAKMAANSVDSDQYVDGSIDTVHIGDAQVTTAKITDGNISTAKIADNAVTSAKIDTNIAIAGTLASTGVLTANAGVVVDNITIDGTEIDLSSGDLTLDVAGEIRLSADDNGEVHFYDGSLHYGSILEENSNLIIQSIVQDEDIIFKGDDGGSVITALTLDMSKAGAATFNDAVIADSFETTAGGTFTTASGNDLNIVYPDTRSLFIKEASTTHVTVDNTGQVGIGTTSPDSTLEVESTQPNIRLTDSDNTHYARLGGSAGDLLIDADLGNGQASSKMTFGVDGTERMRITSGGDLLSNTTTAVGSFYNGVSGIGFGYASGGYGAFVRAGTAQPLYVSTNDQGSGGFIEFSQNGAQRGVISYDGSNMVYGGTSDYRLKKNITPIENALTKISALNPINFDWIESGENHDGFLAHEAQTVVPYAVTGVKDEVATDENSPEEKANGEPLYQMMEYGKLTPLLVKAIQEQQEQIEQLKSEIEALKS
jgi:hypothetical protein